DTADEAIIENVGTTQLRLRTLNNTFETLTFNIPSGPTPSLTINLGAGNDIFTIATHFPVANNSDALSFVFTINGQGGSDDIGFAPTATGNGYVVDGGAGDADV